MNIKEIIIEIERLRYILNKTVETEVNLTEASVVEISKQLDYKLNLYQEMIFENSTCKDNKIS